MQLADQNALITGGSQGLGKVIAEHFLREGARVMLCARNEQELASTRRELAARFGDAKVSARRCDVSDEAQVNEQIGRASCRERV